MPPGYARRAAALSRVKVVVGRSGASASDPNSARPPKFRRRLRVNHSGGPGASASTAKLLSHHWGRSSAGRAPDWQSGGSWVQVPSPPPEFPDENVRLRMEIPQDDPSPRNPRAISGLLAVSRRATLGDIPLGAIISA